VQEICRPGSEGGAKLSFVPTPIHIHYKVVCAIPSWRLEMLPRSLQISFSQNGEDLRR
jgi:hypothetical protein